MFLGTNENWNLWRKQNPEYIPNISKIVVKNRIIENMNLKNVKVYEGYFENVRFINSNLNSINFLGSEFIHAEFINSNLNFAKIISIK